MPLLHGTLQLDAPTSLITKIEFNNFCNSDTVYMLFYNRSTCWKHLRDIGPVLMDAACYESWVECFLNTDKYLLKTSFHCLLSFTFVTFFIHWHLFPAGSSVT